MARGPDSDRIIGERLRRRREFLGLSRFELALACGVEVHDLERFEAGAPITKAQLRAFADALEFPLSDSPD